ncbi:MAG: c-type cytochrome [Terriglobales bacterium]
MKTVIVLAMLLMCSAACDQIRKSDSELGLNPQQAAGRRVFDQRCGSCHEPYSSRSLRGPSLQGLYKKQFMPSGTPANDDRVREVIQLGRAKMPGFSRVLNAQQLDDLLAYLHTL